jgi:hypothetical protein
VAFSKNRWVRFKHVDGQEGAERKGYRDKRGIGD